MKHLRDYQIQAADCIEQEWKTRTSTMAVLPTGAGKTVLFAEVIRRRQPGRAIVIAHRHELVQQARDKIERFAGLDCEVEMADAVAAVGLFNRMPVVVASVQTLVSGSARKRMEKFDPMEFDTLIIDEFHHAPANSYRQVLDYFTKGNPDLKVLGVTATPDRTDEQALGQVCQSVAFNYEIVDAIQDGWLVPIEQQMVTIAGLDFSAVRTTAGDLNGADLAAIMEAEENIQGLCAATLEIIGKRQTIVFTASVAHAEMACNIFNRHRERIAEWVCGETILEKRTKIMKNVLEGETQILCNVGVATEGFDAPGVEVIVMGRPTKSRALYAQMAGRATRPFPGVVDQHPAPDERRAAIASSPKPSCLLVDFVGNSGKHKLVTGADLLGGKYSDEVKDLAKEMLEADGERRNVRKTLEEAQLELMRQAEERRQLEEARKRRLVAKAEYSVKGINPFDAYDIAPMAASRDCGRTRETFSEKQRRILVKMGINPDSMPYSHGKQLLDEQFRRWNFGLCTIKQAARLKQYGYDTRDMTMQEASHLIGGIVKNGWRATGEPQMAPAARMEADDEPF
jgi:superfamily II DNA or RNA helicase